MQPQSAIERTVPVAPVWAGHPVGFALWTQPPHQFVAYYDEQRRMTVAQRTLDSDRWTQRTLPSQLGWDSHNFVTLAVDAAGCLHVSGNMHADPMVYFRSAQPFDIASLEAVSPMVEPTLEQQVTYPRFFRDGEGRLIFQYRHGSSGRGDNIYNVYDLATRRWRRLHDQPLLCGGEQMSAYFQGPSRAADGWFHLCGVWRDDPDAATNHDLCYARSRDLLRWQTSAGEPIALPLTLDNLEVVDPVPAHGGILNANVFLGFDSQARPIITYHKYDAAGDLQVHLARLEGARWRFSQISDWHGYTWRFGGWGSLPMEVTLGPVRPIGDGRLSQRFDYPHGRGEWVLDEATLDVLDTRPREADPFDDLAEMREPASRGLHRRMARESNPDQRANSRFTLLWATQPGARDQPQASTPAPSTLHVVQHAPRG